MSKLTPFSHSLLRNEASTNPHPLHAGFLTYIAKVSLGVKEVSYLSI